MVIRDDAGTLAMSARMLCVNILRCFILLDILSYPKEFMSTVEELISIISIKPWVELLSY